ncbi:hypothetical protein ABIA39_001171 [Nocardia sp. GAS34]
MGAVEEFAAQVEFEFADSASENVGVDAEVLCGAGEGGVVAGGGDLFESAGAIDRGQCWLQ